MSIIKARQLVKRYGPFTAVDGIDFTVESQEVFGFLGSNGAGKSTSLRMIACVSPVTGGQLLVSGMDVRTHGREIRATLGVVPQEDNLDEDLNTLQNLLVYGRYFALSREERRRRAWEALEIMELTHKAASPIDTLSGGMKRRLLIARALLNRPSVMILDEPTTGLDPHARHMVWQRLRLLKSQGTTMVISTHYMDEAAYLCDRLVIMAAGRILASGAPTELIERHVGTDVTEVRIAPWDRDRAVDALRGLGYPFADAGDALLLFAPNGTVPELDLDPRFTVIVRRPPNLEDVFLRLTGRRLDEE